MGNTVNGRIIIDYSDLMKYPDSLISEHASIVYSSRERFNKPENRIIKFHTNEFTLKIIKQIYEKKNWKCNFDENQIEFYNVIKTQGNYSVNSYNFESMCDLLRLPYINCNYFRKTDEDDDLQFVMEDIL